MAIEVKGQSLETTDNGYLADTNVWDESVMQALAAVDGFELTDQHIDVIKYLRAEHEDNAGNQPNERAIVKYMGKLWGKKLTSKDMYQLFPEMPSKQGRKYAGLPQSTRKGGY